MNFFKKNYLTIIIFILCSFFIIKSDYKIYKQEQNFKNNINEKIEYCKLNIENINEEDIQICQKLINGEYNLKKDFYEKFSNILDWDIYYFNILASLILFVISLHSITKIFKDKISLLMLKRQKYFSFFINILKSAYKYIFFWPLIVLVLCIVCLRNTVFNPTLSIESVVWNIDLMSTPVLFIFLYILNIIFHSGFYINIGLIIARYKHNYPIAVILSFLTIIAIELFFEIVVNGIIFGHLLNDYSSGLIFNIVNLFVFNTSEVGGVVNLLIFSFVCFFISLICVFLCYKNKEKLIIDCEKNN